MGDETRRARQRASGRAEQLRDATARLQPHAMAFEMLPDLLGEISAARREAEDGVGVILAAVERILAAERSTSAQDLHDEAQAILEACGFQDLIGQRLVKVSRRLTDLEARLVHLAEVSGPDADLEETEEERRARELILHGPAQGGQEVDQAAIDALFG